MANLAGVPQSRFFPAKLEAEGDDAIFNTLLSFGLMLFPSCYLAFRVVPASQ